MATRYRIFCIIKIDRYDPSERIQFIGGINPAGGRWQLSQKEAISGIETGKWQFYVMVGGAEANVVVSTSRYGNKYIRTISDGEEQNNLLNLPPCS